MHLESSDRNTRRGWHAREPQPTRMEGPDAIRNTFKPFFASVEDFQFKNIKMFPMADLQRERSRDDLHD
jgi:hypothetical protein